MPLQSPKNLYPGVNAHLNSFLQTKGGGWESFHSQHVTAIAWELNKHLPLNYTASPERSLQSTQMDWFAPKSQEIKPDIGIYQTGLSGDNPSAAPVATPPSAMFPLVEVLNDPEDYMMSVAIYKIESGKLPGKIVTRIELLSRSNKPGETSYKGYMAKRADTLSSGISLIEIDYLHESRPVIPHVPSYIQRESNSHPYYVIVNDTYPSPEEGYFKVYGFGVDDPLPIVPIPLAGEERINFDLSLPYNLTFESDRTLQLVVDYLQEPENIETYTPADQERIRRRMKHIADAPS
jgi:hypothetical protein